MPPSDLNEFDQIADQIVMSGGRNIKLDWLNENTKFRWAVDGMLMTTTIDGMLPVHIPVAIYSFESTEDSMLFRLRFTNRRT